VGHGLGGHEALIGGDPSFVTTTFTPEGGFTSISVDTITADVEFLYAEDGICRVEANDRKGIIYTAEVKDGILTIRAEDTRQWYDHISIVSGGHSYLRVYLPAKSYESLTVDMTTGDVTVGRDFTFSGNVTLSVTTGDVALSASVQGDTRLDTTTGDLLVEGVYQALTVTAGTGDVTIRKCETKTLSVKTGSGDVTLEELTAAGAVRVKTTTGEQSLSRVSCGELNLDVNTGDVTLTDTVASGNLRAETTTGDVTLTRSDAATLNLKTTSGAVTGSLLTPKVFYTDTTSGTVDVPRSTEGGICEIKTTSGSIRMTIAE
jgi:DUF4097 and DUF4098 domain-containing protein YvlB